MTTLLLVGCGKMGGAMLARWRGVASSIHVVDPSARPKKIPGVKFYPGLHALPKNLAPDVIVLAVKPQQMAGVLPAYGERFGARPLYLSVAAGKTVASLAALLPPRARVVRAMPNLPAAIGESMTALVAGPSLPAAHKRLATSLMQAIGSIHWIKDESWMDGVTAVSGSGPAYLFLFMEALAAAGVECGLDAKTSLRLVRQTMRGAALLAEQEDPARLRASVTSRGGTTEAAIAALEEGSRFRSLVRGAVQAAARRAALLESGG